MKVLLQGFAIVASILLAFAIDAWWVERQEQADTEDLLKAFVEELDRNLDLAEGGIRFFTEKGETTRKILGIASEGRSAEVNIQQFDELLAGLNWWIDSRFTTGALDSLISGGQLSRVEPMELRVKISRWKESIGQVTQMERQDYDTYQLVLIPYLQQHASLAQISNMMTQRPGGNDKGWVGYQLPNSGTRDHRQLLNDETFLSLVTKVYSDTADGIQYFRNFISEAEDLKASVEQSLD